MIDLRLVDCLEAMRLMDDDSFDLAIVDPPYGIGMSGGKRGSFAIGKGQKIIHEKKDWDNEIPNSEYFEQIKRVSKNQIIWGGNYFLDFLGSTRCFLVFDKINGGNNLSDCELAWTSFDSSVRMFRHHHFLGGGEVRYHPTQKPVALYTWILGKYAKKGNTILDTHLGSGSIAIACHNLGYDLTGYELDPDYYRAAKKRLKQHQKQLRMF